MEEENTPVAHEGETYDAQEDRSSNNGNGSTTSHSSEEFVKVNQDDAPIDEGAGDVTHKDVEEVAPAVGSPSGLEKKLIDKLDPRELRDPSTMSSEQENPKEEEVTEESSDHAVETEAVSQPLVLVEEDYEDDEGVVTGDTPHEDVVEPMQAPPEEPEVKSEVIPSPQVMGVEEVDTKPAPVSLASHVPVADEEKKEKQDQDPVVDLLYWRDIKKTAFVFSFLLLILGSLVYFSVISVFAYAGLAFLTVTVAFRLYKLVLQTLNGTQQPHPFQDLLDHDVALSQEHFQKYTNAILSHLNCTITAARNLFLVQNTITSLKFGVFLWLLTYIGCCFNGLTILIIGIILAFTVPPIYEKYQTQIDNYYGMAREKALALIAAAKSKFPGAKQAKEKAQ